MLFSPLMLEFWQRNFRVMDVSVSVSLIRVLTDCGIRQLCFLVKTGFGEKFGALFFCFCGVFLINISAKKCGQENLTICSGLFLVIVPI